MAPRSAPLAPAAEDAAPALPSEPPARLSDVDLERPVARPKTQPVLAGPPVAAGPAASTSFGGLADALEPEVSPEAPLEEFDELLGIFDGGAQPRDAPTTVVTPRPRPEAPTTAPATVIPSSVPTSVAEPAPAPRGTMPAAPKPPRRPQAPSIEDAVTLSLPSVPRAEEDAPTVALPAVPRRPTPVVPAMPRPRPIEPPRAVVDFPAPGDPAASAQLVAAPDLEGPMLSRVAARVDDDVPRARSSLPIVWIGLTVMLGGALAWVLATQTDLFSGDVVASRQAAALEEAEREASEKQAAIDAKRTEYGTIELDSEPKGARVFSMRDGPEAEFPRLPIDHEYQVLVTAPGHVPRVRIVKGTELAAPVIVDLDPVAAGAPASAIPSERPPKLAAKPSNEAATLTLRSNTPGAQLGLLVGFTPGVKVVDVDVREAHRFLAVLEGHTPAEVVVKGRHFEEGPSGALAFHETIAFVVAPPTPEAAPAVPGAPVAEEEEAADDVVVVDDAAAPAAASAPRKASKKKKKKRRR